MSTWLSFFINLHHYTGITRSSPAQSRSKRCFSIFCLLSRSHGPNLESQVDKNQTFPSVFVYFWFRALKQDLRAKPRSTKLLKGRLRLRAKCHFLRFARECRERRFKRHQVIVRCRQLCILQKNRMHEICRWRVTAFLISTQMHKKQKNH